MQKIIIGFLFFTLLALPALAQTWVSGGPEFGYADRQRLSRRISLEPAAAARWEGPSGEGLYAQQLTSKTYLSPGVAATYTFDLPFGAGEFGFYGVGVYPAYDSYVSSNRIHPDRHAGMLPLPTGLEAFNQWAEGDNLFWKRDKGLGFFATIGAYGVGIGPRLILAGSYQVYLEKKSSTQLYIEVRPGTVRSASVVGGFILAYGDGGTTVESYAHGQGFLLEPATVEGQEAFQLVLQGRFGDAQELLGRDPHDGNMPVAHVALNRRVGYLQWAVATPYIPIFSYARRSETSELDIVREEANGDIIHTHEVDYSQGQTARAGRRQSTQARGVHFSYDKEGKIHVSWRWDWESTNGGPVSLSKAMTQLRRRLDCGVACAYETRGTRGYVGYTHANVTWETTLDDLRERARTLPNLAYLSRAAEAAQSGERNGLRLLAQQLLATQNVLSRLYGARNECVWVKFTVGGEFVKQWLQTTELCPTP